MNMMSTILARPARQAPPALALEAQAALAQSALARAAPAVAEVGPAPTVQPSTGTGSGLLDREERVAILLSRRSGRFAAFAGSWLVAIDRGLPALSPQAAEARSRQARLAALRRFAILYRLDRGGLAFEEDERLARAGYSEAEADVARALVERFNQDWSPPAAPWKRTATWLGLGIAAVFGLDRWLDAGIDDPYVALILSIVMVSAAVSFISVSAHPAGGGPGPRRK